MSRRGPSIVVTGPDEDTEDIIRSSRGLMVPELRASVREKVSSLRPEGLPPPGKTTQGFKGSQRSSSRESAKPKSFRTVRNFWRRLEGDVDNPAPRRFLPFKRTSKAKPEKPKTSGWKMPVLRKISNARESARRKSSLKSYPSKESKRSLLGSDEESKRLTGASIKSVLKSLTSRQGSRKASLLKVPSRVSQQSEKLSSKRVSSRAGSVKSRRSSRLTDPSSSIVIEPKRLSSKLSQESQRSEKLPSVRGSKLFSGRVSSRPGSTRSKRSSRLTVPPSGIIEDEATRRSTRFSQQSQLSARLPSGRISSGSVRSKRSSRLSVPPSSMIEDEPTRKSYRLNQQSGRSEKLSSGRVSKLSGGRISGSVKSKRSSRLTEPLSSITEDEPTRRSTRLTQQSQQSGRVSSMAGSARSTRPSGSTVPPSSIMEIEPTRRSTRLTQQSQQSGRLSSMAGSARSTRPSGSTIPPSSIMEIEPTRRSTRLSQQSQQSGRVSSMAGSARSTRPSGSTIPPSSIMEIESSRRSTRLSQQRPTLSTQEERQSKLSAKRSSTVEQAEEGLTEGDEADKGEEEEEEEEEMGEEESDIEEEMEEEVEEEEEEEETLTVVKPSTEMSRLAPPPPTAVLRPSSLWSALPRYFSDESINRPSVILPVLLEEEKLFHELVAGGDVSAVDDFLSKRPNFNINCENYQGTSALHIAVKDDNEDMVQYLLSLPGIEVRDSHLFAIRDNHPGILVMILDKLQSINPALEFMACSNSPEFAENITPLILAAEAGHFEIVGLLISRGHVIPRPHKPRCFCKEECQAIMKSQDMLSISSGKLHIYRALSNPAYICQTSPDPLLVAFKLSKELLTCGHVDTIYLRQYEALAESLRTFAVEIIAECRTLEEVETILSESKDSNLKGDWTYPRLVLAMDYKQKEFIAHPNVQQVLERTWMGDWIAWRGYRVYIKALYVFPRLLTLPAVLAVLMFSPTSKWAKHFSLPVNKLLSNVASYCIFLLLVFIQSNVSKKNQTRDTKPTGVEVFLVIYVLTFIYNSIRSILKQGPHRFFKFMWNIYELIMEFFFMMAFIFLIAAEIKTTIKGDKNLERKYWYYLDPELISESFFVLAAVMAFMRILLIFQISYHLGPLQVSLGKMTNDCAMFSIIFAIIIIAYTAGLCKFYSYYEDMVQTNPETGEVESTQVNSFTSVLDTFKTLFWGLFGMSSFDVADVIVENIDDGNSTTATNEHHLTEAVGYFAFATYMILTVIVILNMLIATMSNTFQKVTDNVDTEWLFGRTEVYMSYIDLPVLPPPFNVIPTTHALVNLVKGSRQKGGKLIGVDVEKGIDEGQENRRNDDYYVLMSQLVQRYFSTKNSEND